MKSCASHTHLVATRVVNSSGDVTTRALKEALHVPASPGLFVMSITDWKSLDAEDHRRVLALLSEPELPAAREEAGPEMLPPTVLQVLADEMLLRAFPDPPRPVTMICVGVSLYPRERFPHAVIPFVDEPSPPYHIFCRSKPFR